jgi:hypothetical protein
LRTLTSWSPSTSPSFLCTLIVISTLDLSVHPLYIPDICCS